MKFISIVFIGLCLSCSIGKKANNNKVNIDYDLIDFVSIKKEKFASDSIYFLSKEEIQNLINEWNNSEYKGVYKMTPNYWIQINFKNDSIRHFRVNKNLIKEKSDCTYSLSNSNLISNLWKKSEKISEPPKPSFLIECDSISKIAEVDYKNGIKQYTIMGLVEATPFVTYYTEFMKHNYNIVIGANCVPTLKDECYNNTMIEQIENEYGTDFINKSYEKSEKEFNKLKKDKTNF